MHRLHLILMDLFASDSLICSFHDNSLLSIETRVSSSLCTLCKVSSQSRHWFHASKKLEVLPLSEFTVKTRKKTYPILGISLVSKKVAWLDIITWAIKSRTWYTYYMWLYMYLFQRQWSQLSCIGWSQFWWLSGWTLFLWYWNTWFMEAHMGHVSKDASKSLQNGPL